jgi:phosphoglycerol transferase MdoB-like AlkP superfamily enzyme
VSSAESEVARPFPRTRHVAGFVAAALLLGASFRIWLLHERSADVDELTNGELLRLLWIGLRLDLMIAAFLAAPLVVSALAVPTRRLRALGIGAGVWSAAALVALALGEVAGVHFFRYYGFRPNYLVIEHGGDAEVLASVAKAYPLVAVALVGVGAGVAAWLVSRLVSRALARFAPGPPAGVARRWILPVLCVPLVAAAARGGFDHRPLNPSAASFSSNRVANEIAGNGVLNVAFAVKDMAGTDPLKLADVQPAAPKPAEAVARAKTLLGRRGRFAGDSENPLARVVESPARDKPLNVVVIVMESFTARLVGHLGGELSLAPELDRLAAEGVVFANCYATGERTVQGLEAVLSSFPPLPGVSVVRRPEAARGFATLASVLASQRGYDTFFLYGGQGIFDHMLSFFRGNGYRAFLEEKDFASPKFKGSWGASDEDVFARAIVECRARAQARTPFLCSVMTVSLHSPWEYPKGRITELPADVAVPAGFVREELNNFLYADWAIGEFMREARKEPWFDDTVFVFVGDHGVHLRGRDLVPSEEYRVAALLYAPRHVAPRRVERVTSQIDLAPTVLGVLGGSWRTPFFGDDVLADPDAEGFAVLVYKKRWYGVRRGPRLTTIAEAGARSAFDVQPGVSLAPTPLTAVDDAAADDALAILQAAETLLRSGRYTADPATPR